MGSPCPVKSRGSSRAPFTSRETTVMPPLGSFRPWNPLSLGLTSLLD